MYKCLECGHIFDDGEEGTVELSYSECWGQKVSELAKCCPCCEGNFDETVRCQKCGGEFLADELKSGFCVECLNESINADTALQFMLDYERLDDFFFRYEWQIGLAASIKLTEQFINDCTDLFKRKVLDDKILGKDDFAKKIKAYIVSELYDYAEWYEEFLRKEATK